tara:strand:- start:760 stop:1845 length:1086 start_codon:yes stop_codon:yes gene_type:complete
MDALIEKFGDTDGNINVPQDALVKALKSMKTDGRRGRKTRAPRDPDAPKRPTSSYMLWLNDNRQTIANTHFPKNDDGEHCYPEGHDNAGEPLKGRAKVSEITKKAGALWKDVSDEDKQPYLDTFTNAQKAYYEAKGEYVPTGETKTKTSFDHTQRPDAPDGWTGAHEAKYLKKVSKDPETGKNIKSFKDFDEAVAMANELGNACGGITLTSTGFSLRVRAKLHDNPMNEPSGLASWTKEDASTSDDSDSDGETAPKKVVKKSPKKSEKASEKSEKTEKTEKASEKTEKKAKKAKKVVLKVAEPAPEPEPESESEEEDMEVEQISIDGDDYFLNEKTGDIYDPETQEVVGKSKKGKHKLFKK